MQGDKATRNKAIPFEALAFDEADLNLFRSDFVSVAQVVPIRVTKPYQAELVEAYLSIQLHAANSTGFSVRVLIGRFSGVDYAADSVYTEAEIAAGHRKLTGVDTPIAVAAGGTLFIDNLSLLQALPQPGDATYDADAFVIVFVFNAAPTTTTGWNLDAFRVTGSGQMGLL
jgi:hypothetical protein